MGVSRKKINWSCPEHEQSLGQKSYDWLSDLPTDILLHILSFLDISEVVKTSLLSRKWRFIWSSIPCLKFDFKDFCGQEHCLSLSHEECLSKFWFFVKWAIITRDRNVSPIHKLQFLCDYFDAYQLELFISLCAVRNVEELDLLAGYGIEQCPLYCSVNRSFNRVAHNLNNLVELEPFSGFANLKTLHLVRVRFRDADITEKLFSDCGILENLSLERCCFMAINFLNISANKLRKLHFDNIGPNWCESMCRFAGSLILQTPNLVSLCYIGLAIQFYEFSDMLFLKYASFQVHSANYRIVPCQELGAIVSGVDHVEELSMSSPFVLYFVTGRSGGYSSAFDYLRRLKLELQCNGDHIEGLINFLRNSPNLEVLRIKIFQPWLTFNWKSREADVPCLSRSLKEIEVDIASYHDMPESLELIKFFLQNGKSLERIEIMQKKKKVNAAGFFALHEVRLASEAVSVSVTSMSPSGKVELMHLVYKKEGGVSVQTQTRKVKIRLRRSVRIAAKKLGGSS